jgi:hypothetical protein
LIAGAAVFYSECVGGAGGWNRYVVSQYSSSNP